MRCRGARGEGERAGARIADERLDLGVGRRARRGRDRDFVAEQPASVRIDVANRTGGGQVGCEVAGPDVLGRGARETLRDEGRTLVHPERIELRRGRRKLEDRRRGARDRVGDRPDRERPAGIDHQAARELEVVVGGPRESVAQRPPVADAHRRKFIRRVRVLPVDRRRDRIHRDHAARRRRRVGRRAELAHDVQIIASSWSLSRGRPQRMQPVVGDAGRKECHRCAGAIELQSNDVVRCSQ